ncbi:hypothetical protein [Solirubrobacter soli]|uniref:hypothetical protein n=1 Tax=Solirubrobacter soli TaxID=363832 RepID=UPI0004265CFD|nr:hypothetical protein [Solirubrobacter soli]
MASFEGLDAVRMSRGEHCPYEPPEGQQWVPALALIRPSAWLRDRHAYEAEHYGAGYEWGRGDTMLVDTHHHLLVFHDEFVEVLARGVRRSC